MIRTTGFNHNAIEEEEFSRNTGSTRDVEVSCYEIKLISQEKVPHAFSDTILC